MLEQKKNKKPSKAGHKLIDILEKLMAAIDDLNAAITALDTDVKALIASHANSTPNTQVVAATAAVQAVDAEVKAALPPV